MRLSIILKLLAFACTIDAAAACSKPSFYATEPDEPSSYSKPTLPYCFHDRTCDEWEVERYISEVEDYVRKLQRYADDAISFSEDARSFAEDAIAYAKCEADDVNHQHR